MRANTVATECCRSVECLLSPNFFISPSRPHARCSIVLRSSHGQRSPITHRHRKQCQCDTRWGTAQRSALRQYPYGNRSRDTHDRHQFTRRAFRTLCSYWPSITTAMYFDTNPHASRTAEVTVTNRVIDNTVKVSCRCRNN